MNRNKVLKAVQLFLDGVGERFPGDGLEKTPKRVARAWCDEFLAGYKINPEKLILPMKHGERCTKKGSPSRKDIVLVQDICFHSVCVHHLLPFIGRAHIAYIPDGKIVGLSKIARILDAYSRRLQIQERLTRQIAETLGKGLDPQGVAVIIEAEHLCMILRGVRKRESRIVTTCFTGCFETNEKLRSSLIDMIYGK